ncbi:Heme-transporting ATPase protein [Dioscorea alata]|uniref:Heme-transporting ATPase protein n=1 Tax=Dioscorea alata TaxID=55571 RepID=A0ACB7WIE5_DIOAL|nr:Heme-transporting ATPase protein [Dioscorea alata]
MPRQCFATSDVSVHDGSALVLTGANGSGKTTFLRMLAGFSRPSAGEILWNGHDITSPGLTVLDNVQFLEILEGKSGKAKGALELMELGRLPSVALDDEGVQLLKNIIAEHMKQGGIVLVATHLPIQIEEAMSLGLP